MGTFSHLVKTTEIARAKARQVGLPRYGFNFLRAILFFVEVYRPHNWQVRSFRSMRDMTGSDSFSHSI